MNITLKQAKALIANHTPYTVFPSYSSVRTWDDVMNGLMNGEIADLILDYYEEQGVLVCGDEEDDDQWIIESPERLEILIVKHEPLTWEERETMIVG